MSKITIDSEKCENVDCGDCIDMCPEECFVMGDGEITIQHPDLCDLCEVCMDICPNEAIKVEPDE
ncbi:MAG: 4Fe-4S binding protein [Methanobacteriaceae archaeon]|nr:4Fe-4S binding protein [Methanobacteriaceae archaeon]